MEPERIESLHPSPRIGCGTKGDRGPAPNPGIVGDRGLAPNPGIVGDRGPAPSPGILSPGMDWGIVTVGRTIEGDVVDGMKPIFNDWSGGGGGGCDRVGGDAWGAWGSAGCLIGCDRVGGCCCGGCCCGGCFCFCGRIILDVLNRSLAFLFVVL